MNRGKDTPRPKIKIELTTIDIILETLGWVVLLALWALILTNYSDLPDRIPTHFNGSGQPDSFGDKSSIFILSAIASLLFLMMTLLNRIPHKFNYLVEITTDNALVQYTNATKMMRYLKLLIVCIFGIISLGTIRTSTGEAAGLCVWFLPLILGMFFIPTWYFIIRTLRTK